MEITSVDMQPGQQPKTLKSMFVIVEGRNVDHPAVAGETPILVFMCDITDPEYGPKNLGSFLQAIYGTAGPAIAEKAITNKDLVGKRVRVDTRERLYGPKSPKSGQKFWAQDYYPASTGQGEPRHVPAAPAAPAPVKAAEPVKAPIAPAFPPEGWYVDPHGRGFYNAFHEIKSEAELRASVGA